jgi:hypothetical protein
MTKDYNQDCGKTFSRIEFATFYRILPILMASITGNYNYNTIRTGAIVMNINQRGEMRAEKLKCNFLGLFYYQREHV